MIYRLFGGMVSVWMTVGFFIAPAQACDICTYPRPESAFSADEDQNGWAVSVSFDRQDWNTLPAQDAHEQHEEGHDVHNKTTEDFLRLHVSKTLSQRWRVDASWPYIVRRSLGVEDGKVGQKEISRGVGDLSLQLTTRLADASQGNVFLITGVKVPTGATDERDFFGDKFEPELQPGSGSWDNILGLMTVFSSGPWEGQVAARHVWKRPGAQEFEFGDVSIVDGHFEKAFWVRDNEPRLKAGIHLHAEWAGKDKQNGDSDPDSGGFTLLLGPRWEWRFLSFFSLHGEFSYPIVQDLGGVHQEINFTWKGSLHWAW